MRRTNQGRHRGRLAWYVVPMAVGTVAGAVITAGGAFAWMNKEGSATTTATIDDGIVVTTSVVVPTGTHLYAGGPKGGLTITINPSDRRFRITGIAQDTSRSVGVTGAVGACDGTVISMAPITGLSITVNTTAVTRTVTRAVAIASNAPNTCQGATFTIPVVLTGRSI